jgi:hypothetical protein
MRSLALVSLALSSCSLVFNPANVPESDCPTSAMRCPARPNATASCTNTACAFSCSEGFRDADGAAENGCEAACATVPAPASLSATSRDDGTSLEWSFAPVDNATSYRLCTGVSAGTPSCISVPTTSCFAGRCTAITMEHPNRTAVSGQVQSVDACGGLTPEPMSTRAQGFTVRTLDFQPWTGDICTPAVTITGDVLTVDQPLCQSFSNVGEETWSGGTFEVELRPSVSAANLAAGFLFTSGQRRVAIIITSEKAPIGEGTLLVRESRSNNPFWTTLATSGAFLPPATFTRLRVVQRNNVWSVSVGPPGALSEVLRYRDDEVGTSRFRLGLHAFSVNLIGGAGRMDFQKLTVSPAATLPAIGPTSRITTFDGNGPRPSSRLTGTTQVRFEACPSFPPAAGCASCLPAPNSTCARVSKAGVGTITIDVPPGIDPTQPWSVSMRLAPTADGGTPNGAFLTSPWGAIVEPTNDGGVRGLGGDWPGASAARDTWHQVELRLVPGMSRFSARWDGQSLSTPMVRFPPFGWNAFGGAFVVGGTGFDSIDFWVSDVTVSQP